MLDVAYLLIPRGKTGICSVVNRTGHESTSTEGLFFFGTIQIIVGVVDSILVLVGLVPTRRTKNALTRVAIIGGEKAKNDLSLLLLLPYGLVAADRLPRGYYLLLALVNNLRVHLFLLLGAVLQNGQKPFSVLASLGRRLVISTIAIITALLLRCGWLLSLVGEFIMDELVLVKRGASVRIGDALLIVTTLLLLGGGGSVEELLGVI